MQDYRPQWEIPFKPHDIDINNGPEGAVMAFLHRQIDTPEEYLSWVIPVGKLARVGYLAGRGAANAGSKVAERLAGAGSQSRGLSKLGGVIEETGRNASGGRIYTSTGAINQNDFAGVVNAGLTRGDDVHILTGAHGLADGTHIADAGLLADDVARFGKLPGVQVHDLPSMSTEAVQKVMNGPGTIIGGFCNSGACLARYGG